MPAQRDPRRRDPARPAFVLHDHRLPRPHHDLRLEEDGVLRSWALPRGLPTDPSRNRLAVAVPDHDLDHLGYTDEAKSVADTGWWQEHDRTDRRLLFTLHGRDGTRRYALVHTGGSSPQDGHANRWLLHLTKEQPAPPDRTDERTEEPVRPPEPPASPAAPS